MATSELFARRLRPTSTVLRVSASSIARHLSLTSLGLRSYRFHRRPDSGGGEASSSKSTLALRERRRLCSRPSDPRLRATALRSAAKNSPTTVALAALAWPACEHNKSALFTLIYSLDLTLTPAAALAWHASAVCRRGCCASTTLAMCVLLLHRLARRGVVGTGPARWREPVVCHAARPASRSPPLPSSPPARTTVWCMRSEGSK